jgi:hypothetical protein
MTHWQLPSGIQDGLPFVIPKDWTTKQAVAVIDLIDDVREVIYQHYGHKIMKYRRKERGAAVDVDSCQSGDEPF